MSKKKGKLVLHDNCVFTHQYTITVLQKFELSVSGGYQPDFVKVDMSDNQAKVALSAGQENIEFEVSINLLTSNAEAKNKLNMSYMLVHVIR